MLTARPPSTPHESFTFALTSGLPMGRALSETSNGPRECLLSILVSDILVLRQNIEAGVAGSCLSNFGSRAFQPETRYR